MELQQQYGSDVKIIGVPGSSDVASLQDFADSTGTGDVTHVLDEGAIWARFEVSRRQTYILATVDGEVARVDFDDLDAALSNVVG